MTIERYSNLLPKLRFPEFRNDLWIAPQFVDLYSFKRTNTLSRDKLNYEVGTIRNIHYGDIHTKFKSLLRVGEEHVPYVNLDIPANEFDDEDFCKEGDIVLADASEDLDDVGKAIEVVSLDGESVVAGTHTILGTRRGNFPVVGFGGQLLQSPVVRAAIKKEAQGTKVYGISAKRISTILVPIPPTADEQQKIAGCLGSLDDLITAEGRKLEALRQHKQGLMKKLFPQPGETVPKIRFPEFRNAQGWSLKPLGEILTPIVREREKPTVPYTGLGIRSHGRGTFRKEFENPEKISMTRLYEVNCNDLIVNITFAWEGAIAIAQPEDTGALVSYRFPTYRFVHNAVLPEFFQNPILDKQFIYKLGVISPGGAGRNRVLNKHDFLKIELALPRISEQRKIADCLGSLDDLIAAESQKLETLQQHKQGLMQQLFPSLEAK